MFLMIQPCAAFTLALLMDVRDQSLQQFMKSRLVGNRRISRTRHLGLHPLLFRR